MSSLVRDGYRILGPGRALERRLDRLRRVGHRGGYIPSHRALLVSPRDAAKIVGAVGLAAAFCLGLYLARDGVAHLWLEVMEFWRVALGLSGYSTLVPYELAGLHFQVPYLHFPAGMPDGLLWLIGAVFAALLLVVSLLLPHRMLPVSYLLRIVGFFQATAQVYFAFWMERFPYGGSGYVHGMLVAGLFLLWLAPVVLGLTYYLFDFSLGRKAWLTLLVMGHLVLMLPLQCFLHAWLLNRYSLLFMPVLFFIVGLPLNVMVFIAFFGWGFSWRNRLHCEDVQQKVGP